MGLLQHLGEVWLLNYPLASMIRVAQEGVGFELLNL